MSAILSNIFIKLTIFVLVNNSDGFGGTIPAVITYKLSIIVGWIYSAKASCESFTDKIK